MILRAAGLLLAGVSCFAACIPVTGSRIFARDLARADSRFAALPSTVVVGFSAAPGSKRVFSPAELQRIAKSNGLQISNPSELCFELPMRRIGEEETLAAMRRSLPEGAQIQIAELPAFDAPAGELEFPLDQLDPAPPGPEKIQLWRGYVKYAETRRALFWARVTVTVRSTTVIAARDLPPDVPIAADSLRIETRTGPPRQEAAAARGAARMEDIAGRAPKRLIRAGAAVSLAEIADPPTVKPGDSIRVEVRSGLAHLGFDAVVEAPARAGDIIELKNPINGKTFKARLESAGRAVVVVAGEERSGGEKL